MRKEIKISIILLAILMFLWIIFSIAGDSNSNSFDGTYHIGNVSHFKVSDANITRNASYAPGEYDMTYEVIPPTNYTYIEVGVDLYSENGTYIGWTNSKRGSNWNETRIGKAFTVNETALVYYSNEGIQLRSNYYLDKITGFPSPDNEDNVTMNDEKDHQKYGKPAYAIVNIYDRPYDNSYNQKDVIPVDSIVIRLNEV